MNTCGLSGTLTTITVNHCFNIRSARVYRTLSSCIPRGGHSRLIRARSGALVISTCGTGPADVVTTLMGFHRVRTRRGITVLNTVGRLNRKDQRRRRGMIRFLGRYRFRHIVLIKPRFTKLSTSFRRCRGIGRMRTVLTTRPIRRYYILVGNSGDVGLDRLPTYLWRVLFFTGDPC